MFPGCISFFPCKQHSLLIVFIWIHPSLLLRKLKTTSQSILHWDTLFSNRKFKFCFDTYDCLMHMCLINKSDSSYPASKPRPLLIATLCFQVSRILPSLLSPYKCPFPYKFTCFCTSEQHFSVSSRDSLKNVSTDFIHKMKISGVQNNKHPTDIHTTEIHSSINHILRSI